MLNKLKSQIGNILFLIEYCVYALIIGVVVAAAGTALGKTVSYATSFRNQNPYIIWLLPLAGLLIVFFYRLPKENANFGTNRILQTVDKNDEGVPFFAAPLIFIGTSLTHLFGGSAGREGAALMLGASLSGTIGRIVRLPHRDMRIITMCGMAAGFTALFGTPLAAGIFALEILGSKIQYGAMLPVMLTAYITKVFAQMFGAHAESFTLHVEPQFEAITALKVLLLGVLAAILSMIMCAVLESTHHVYVKLIKNTYARVFIGGLVVSIAIYYLGPLKYAGAGGNIIEAALEGKADTFAFAIKLILTALTLEAGFKGGEIVPTLYIGSTFGCVVAPLIGLNPAFCAAMAMMAMFAGNTNCPLASVLLAMELFGGKGMPFFAIVIFTAYALSGKFTLYTYQKLGNKFGITK